MSRKSSAPVFESNALPERQDGTPVLQIRDLNVRFPSEDGVVHAVRGVDLTVHAGEVVGLVGESGSGKSVTSMSVMGLLDDTAEVQGSIKLHGTELLGRSDDWMSRIRGKKVAMVFQDPLSALTPVYTVGDQIVEALQVHGKYSDRQAWDRALELLRMVGIPNPEVRIKSFPHEFSGGMRQRVVIAMAIANDPDLIIADEPTTALDVTIQAQILDLLRVAQRETHAGVIMITHDLGVVAGLADRVAVMYAGRIIERSSVEDAFYHSRHPYTIGLLGSLPRPDLDKDEPLTPVEGNPPSLLALPPGCPFAPRCPMVTAECVAAEPALVPTDRPDHNAACIRHSELAGKKYADVYPRADVPPAAEERSRSDEVILHVENLVKTYPLMKGAVFKRRVGTVHAVDHISFDIRTGETLGLVGESGCGKTTTIMSVLELAAPEEGKVVVLGHDTADLARADRRKVRQDLQVVFQDPMASLDPRLPIYDIIAEPLKYNGYPKADIPGRVEELMDLVGLEPAHANRYPRNFSGGQKQRVGIARALALEPKLLVLDEPVSALDVSIQAGVLNLLEKLRIEMGLSYLFVAHDLSVVRHITHRVAVMYLGHIVELGPVSDVFDNPEHPYTQALLSAIPVPDPAKEKSRSRILLEGDLPSPANPPKGCPFHTRCPKFKTLDDSDKARCTGEEPLLAATPGHQDREVACHFPEAVDVF
ncbi:MAG: ABC transporter ATP-binding protein [Acidipropionibacterium acidipropionici]|jgi:peptide/nickel transport system ATP-binding protein|uniref:Peptide ABC transporter ATP-binding protein n=1 Tax=Acidipropionibacterium acidipropionici TaxID=1748 RepID=A0AAC9AN54_9ACTN|nr:ABC transporter ATP-binding protein [Acidipropionibacterium acidipropionici]AMS05065.1 peptide ABC transporter ATP-binding protein [Acidipropionibacterium acidipropionici]AOZ46546.1 peptide ABC transporter ATP-binding protein [Acidipropionibacterium acidipropionici]AZP37401.1 oligopeptide ABC transporter ATP-binding protein OppF [Acidipropionibacterium acidipropionici]QCV94442.1 ABC transporter ATP-binding protein [Acidipropionibacterium acidipropionici]